MFCILDRSSCIHLSAIRLTKHAYWRYLEGVSNKQINQKEGLKLPNTTHKDTPVGSEDAAVVVSQFGTMPMFHTFDHGPQDHVHLCELHALVDFQAATTITGPKVRRKIILYLVLLDTFDILLYIPCTYLLTNSFLLF